MEMTATVCSRKRRRLYRQVQCGQLGDRRASCRSASPSTMEDGMDMPRNADARSSADGWCVRSPTGAPRATRATRATPPGTVLGRRLSGARQSSRLPAASQTILRPNLTNRGVLPPSICINLKYISINKNKYLLPLSIFATIGATPEGEWRWGRRNRGSAGGAVR
jgi:hypothetical protein